MKIIHIVLGKANPDRMNGVNKVAYQLAKTQTTLGHEVMIWGIARSATHDYPERNFPTRLFRHVSNWFRVDPELSAAIGQLEPATVVHIHGSFIPAFYTVSKLLYKAGVPYVYTPHGALTPGAMQQGKWRKKIYYNLFEKKLIARAKAVQMLGDQEYSYLEQLQPSARMVLIPNGMDTGELPVIPDNPPNRELILSFCGRLDAYHKGLDLLLHGFARFLQKGHQARLELIGDGKDRKMLENLSRKLGIHERITFHGSRFGAEKYLLMAKGDVFLHTSRMEGFPMAVLEAASLEKPCLTTEPTNINRFIRAYDAGFPVKGDPSPENICDALESASQAHRQNDLKSKGLNARKMIETAFDWNTICRDLVTVYHA